MSTGYSTLEIFLIALALITIFYFLIAAFVSIPYFSNMGDRENDQLSYIDIARFYLLWPYYLIKGTL